MLDRIRAELDEKGGYGFWVAVGAGVVEKLAPDRMEIPIAQDIATGGLGLWNSAFLFGYDSKPSQRIVSLAGMLGSAALVTAAYTVGATDHDFASKALMWAPAPVLGTGLLSSALGIRFSGRLTITPR